MKKYDLFDAIGNVDDKYLTESEILQSERTYSPDGIAKTLAVAASLILIFGAMALLPRLLFERPLPHSHSFGTSVTDTDDSTDTVTEPSHSVPSADEVLAAYRKATEAANWFRLTQYGLEIDNSDSVTVDGMPYYRVTTFETYDKFIEYLNSLFENGVTHMLLETAPNFKEHNGKLYLAPADGGSNICIGSIKETVKLISDTEIKVVATVSITDVADRTDPDPKFEVIGTVDVVFPYEKLGDKWVFTDFPDTDLVNTEKFIGTALETKPELYNYYECGGMTLVLPKNYEHKYSVLINSPEALATKSYSENLAMLIDGNMLFEVYYGKPEGWEYGDAYFYEIFRIVRYSHGEYERNVLGSTVARRDVLGYDGEYYYVMQYPSSAFMDPGDSEFYSVINSCTEAARLLFGKYNELEEADPAEFYQRPYTYDSAHKYYRYYPYGTENKDKSDTYYTLVLSQPADRGADGIWCVERWYSGIDGKGGNIHPVFPASGDLSAKEYYESLQRKVSDGQTAVPMKYLDPLSAAINFTWDVIGHDFADASYFVEVDGLPDGEWNY